MPDYLGDDQRRVKSDAGDGDKIQSEQQLTKLPPRQKFSVLVLFNAHPQVWTREIYNS